MNFPNPGTVPVGYIHTHDGRSWKLNADGTWDVVVTDPMAEYTAEDVLAKIKTVDGPGSGLDADLLDGQEGVWYLDLANSTGTLPLARLPSLTKAMVGLENVDNTSDASKPISTATQSALDLKAPVNNPSFTGTVTAPLFVTTGTGEKFRIGDDASLFDVNLANTLGIRGTSDATVGYIVFGNSANRFGWNGTQLTFGTDKVWHAGNDGAGSGLDADTVDGIDSADMLVPRGTVSMTAYSDVAYDAVTQPGIHRIAAAGSSRATMVFNAQGSTGPVQMEFSYLGDMRFRNRTDSLNWTTWKSVWTSLNFDPALKADLASPTFTGTPRVPTPATTTNDTTIASTAYTVARIANDAPTRTGGGASGSWGISVTGSSTSINTVDTRAVTTTPDMTTRGLALEFKNNSAEGLSDGGTYFAEMTLRPWGVGTDWSGGAAHQIGFTSNGNLWRRFGTGTSWSTWHQIWDSKTFDPSTKLNTSAYTAADVLTKIKTVDGVGSGLDAELLAGVSASDYLGRTNAQTITGEKTFKAHVHGETMSNKYPVLGGFVVDMHPESDGQFTIPYLTNDLAYLTSRGGTVTSNHPDYPNGSVLWFDGAAQHSNIDRAKMPAGGMVITIMLPQILYWGTKIGIGFGPTTWRARSIKLEVFDVALNAWKVVNDTTGWDRAIYQIPTTGGSGGMSGIRFTLDDWDGAGARISQIWALNYASTLSKMVFVSRDGGDLYGTLKFNTLGANHYLELDSNKNVVSYAKQSAFNRPFGTTANTIAEGNHTHTADAMPAYTGDVTSPAGSTVNTIANGAVTLGKMANLAANSIIGNNTGSAATPVALSTSQVRTLLSVNNLDNTSDLNKPVSTATQAALDLKVSWSQIGAANGVAGLGPDGKVPSDQLPSFVDDVLEAANYASLPTTGETGKLYLTLDNNRTYRWSGSTYVWINSSVGSADTATRWATARTLTLSGKVSGSVSIDGSSDVTLNVTGLTGTKADVGLGNVDNTSDANKPISTATQTALNLKLDSSAYTAADVLSKIKGVDGATSGLDADLLDGLEASYFLPRKMGQAVFFDPEMFSSVTSTQYKRLGSIYESNGQMRVFGTLGGHTPAEGRATVDLNISLRTGFRVSGSIIGKVGTGAWIEVRARVNDGDPTTSPFNSIYDVYLVRGSWYQSNVQAFCTGSTGLDQTAVWSDVVPDAPLVWSLATYDPGHNGVRFLGDVPGSTVTLWAGTNKVWDDNNFDPATKLNANANAVSASKLLTARTIGFGGVITGSGQFDGSGDVTFNTSIADGALTIAKTAGLQTALNEKADNNHKYHSFNVGEYFFDNYQGARYLRLFIDNARTDLVRFRPISQVEYWNGTAWVAWVGGDEVIKPLFDGREDTVVGIDREHRRFRFVVNKSTGWPSTVLLALQSSWTYIPYMSMSLTLENQVSGVWTVKDTAVFASPNTGNEWGTHLKVVGGLHDGQMSTRITFDITDWEERPANSAYNVPLRNLMLLSNYEGAIKDPFTWNYDRVVNFHATPTVSGASIYHTGNLNLNDYVNRTGSQEVSGFKNFTAGSMSITKADNTEASLNLYSNSQYARMFYRNADNNFGISLWDGTTQSTRLRFANGNWNVENAGLNVGGNTVWHAGNDGAGSGLDSDLLDGQNGSWYQDLTNSTGSLALSKIASIATASLLGRNTTGTGGVEVLSTTTARTLLSINNVDNTSDANKPISTATQTALNLKANAASPTFTGNITLANDDTGLFLNGGGAFYKKLGGGVRIRRHSANTDPMVESYDGTQAWTIYHAGNFNPSDKLDATANAASATRLLTPRTIGLSGVVTATGVSFDGTGNITLATSVADGAIDLVKVAGLQTALNDRVLSSSLGVANGVATLGSDGKVPASQLPAVEGGGMVQYPSLADFPATGNTARLYVAQDTERTYRWSGSAYVWINSTVDTADTAGRWTTARTLTLTGDVTGSVTFDGSGNVSMEAVVGDNSHTHTTIPSTTASQFVGFSGGTTAGGFAVHSGNGAYLRWSTTEWQVYSNWGTTTYGTMRAANFLRADGTAVSYVGHTHAISDITSLQTTLNSKLDSTSYTAADVLTKIKTVDGSSSGLDADQLDGVEGANYVRADLTYLGRIGGTGTDSVTNTAQAWSDLPAGYSRFMHANITTAGGLPSNSYGYFHKVAQRDVSGGWAGIWLGYGASGHSYVGRAGTSADLPTWEKIWTEVNDGAGSGLDSDLLDGQQGSWYQNAGNLNAGTLLAARMPALTGDVTTAAGAVATTIANGAVTLAKMANLAANSILGNNTGSAATPLALTGAQVKTLLALTKTDVGLSNVDNTSDANKPISTAVQTALNLKQNSLGFTPENVANKGVANGYAGLGADGKVPASQLPSFVDDVLETADFAGLPATGETGKIYVTTDNNRTYRWSGSTYVEISASPGSTDAVPEGNNLYFTWARAQAAVVGAASTIVVDNLPSNRVVVSNAAGKIVSSSVSNVELDYLWGVTSSVQEQLNSKLGANNGVATNGLKITSTAGSAVLTLEADTTNTNENGNPTIVFSQDGALIQSAMGLDADNYFCLQPRYAGTTTFDGVYRKNATGGRHLMWDAGNDGSGSGLDADLLDGKHASEFLDLVSNQTITGTTTFRNHVMAGTLSGVYPAIDGFVADLHPEASAPFTLPFISNDLAYLFQRGGSVTTNHPDCPNGQSQWFDGQPTYGTFSKAGVPAEGMIIEITLPTKLNWGTKYGIHFGSPSWMARGIKFEVFRETTQEWHTVNEVTGWTRGIYQVSFGSDGNGVSKIRFTLTDFPGNPRIAQIWALNYNSSLSKMVFVGRDGGDLYGSLKFNSLTANHSLELDANKNVISVAKQSGYNLAVGTTAGTVAAGNHTHTKADVGLGNVDNTSDASKPVSTAQQAALDLKANLASPALTGTPTAPTAARGTNTTQLATTAYVQDGLSTVRSAMELVIVSSANVATLVTNTEYLFNTGGTLRSGTLPASAPLGFKVTVKAIGGQVRIIANGNSIVGVTSGNDLLLADGNSVTLVAYANGQLVVTEGLA